MIVTHETEKLSDAIIYFVENTKYCGKTKLFKLLFFFDCQHFRETGRPSTGLCYVTWERGPAPADLWQDIERGTLTPKLARAVQFETPTTGRGFTKIIPRREFDGVYFSKRELRILEELASIYDNAKADEIVEITHLKNSPWKKTVATVGMNQPIDFRLAIDNSHERQLDEEDLNERIEETRETREMLNATR